MVFTLRFFLIAALCLGCVEHVYAQQREPGEHQAEEAIVSVVLPAPLDRVLRDYEQGWQARDAEALAALFTPGGFILRPGHPPVRGRAAIAEAYQNSGGPLHLRALAYAQEDSVAYIIGGYRGSPDQPDAGKFILTLQQREGRWYITADMDNRNR